MIKLSRRVSPRALRNAVTRYLEWEAFAYWARTALEVGTPLPRLSGEGSQQKMSVSCGGMPPHGAPTRKNNRTVASTGLSTGSRTTSLLVPRSEAGSMCLSTRRICIRGMPVWSTTGTTRKHAGRMNAPTGTRRSASGSIPPLPDSVLQALDQVPEISSRYYFWRGDSRLAGAVATWQRTLQLGFPDSSGSERPCSPIQGYLCRRATPIRGSVGASLGPSWALERKDHRAPLRALGERKAGADGS